MDIFSSDHTNNYNYYYYSNSTFVASKSTGTCVYRCIQCTRDISMGGLHYTRKCIYHVQTQQFFSAYLKDATRVRRHSINVTASKEHVLPNAFSKMINTYYLVPM